MTRFARGAVLLKRRRCNVPSASCEPAQHGVCRRLSLAPGHPVYPSLRTGSGKSPSTPALRAQQVAPSAHLLALRNICPMHRVYLQIAHESPIACLPRLQYLGKVDPRPRARHASARRADDRIRVRKDAARGRRTLKPTAARSALSAHARGARPAGAWQPCTIRRRAACTRRRLLYEHIARAEEHRAGAAPALAHPSAEIRKITV